MKELKVGIYFEDKDGNIIKRPIGANWHINKNGLKSDDTHFFDAVVTVLEENLKLQLKKEIFLEMLNEMKERYE